MSSKHKPNCRIHTCTGCGADSDRAKIKKLELEVNGLKAQRFAYASEFPPDSDGEYDVGSIHENIRKLKAEIIKLEDKVTELYPLTEAGQRTDV